jgi:hypothetical protein
MVRQALPSSEFETAEPSRCLGPTAHCPDTRAARGADVQGVTADERDEGCTFADPFAPISGLLSSA